MYSKVKLSEESLLEGHDSVEEKDEESHQPVSQFPLPQHYRIPAYIWGLQLLFFLISSSLLLSSFSQWNSQAGICKDYMPMYSPALEGVINTGFYQRFDGSFATPNEFKGPPSPSIDGHWRNITYANGMILSTSIHDDANTHRWCDQHFRGDFTCSQRFG
jgi:hypothetical protein